MKKSYRRSLLAGLIAGMVCVLGWSAETPGQTTGSGSQAPWVPVEDQSQGTGPAWKQESPSTDTASGTAGDNQLYAMTPDELSRLEVLGSDGKEIGEIKRVVSNRVNGKLYAVISTGGILGMGAEQTPVSLDELRLDGNQLHISATEDELSVRERYAPELYTEVAPDDRPVSEFSAFEERAE